MKIPPGAVGWLIGVVYRLWCATLRYTEVNRDQPDGLCRKGRLLVFVSWHGEIFAFPYKRRDWRIFAIVSRSRDGEFLARILQSQGIYPLRGSSSRGGVAALVRGAKFMRDEKMNGYVTVDGPRGPIHEVKDGALFLAHRAGAYLVPLRAVYERAKIFGSWDRFRLPLPFSKVSLIFGEPYMIDAETLTEEVLAKERRKLKTILDGMVQEKS